MGLIEIFCLNALLLYAENILSWKASYCQFNTGGKNCQVGGDLKDPLVQAWERFTYGEKYVFFYFIKKKKKFQLISEV